MGVQGLPFKDHYLLQAPMEELLKALLRVRKQWLASAREGQKYRVAEQAEKCPEERQFMTNWLLQGYFQSSVRYGRCVVPAPTCRPRVSWATLKPSWH
jgi:hypothetical protein